MDAGRELFARAKAAVFGRGDDDPLPAVVAWVDGYASGHTDAIEAAKRIIDETPFPMRPDSEPTPFLVCGEYSRTSAGMVPCRLEAGHEGGHSSDLMDARRRQDARKPW